MPPRSCRASFTSRSRRSTRNAHPTLPRRPCRRRGRHAKRRSTVPKPSDEETPMPDRVLIVGAGPTGLTAALELSRLGIAVRIIDKQAAPPTTSHAVGVQERTLEVLELRGLANEMVRLGNP